MAGGVCGVDDGIFGEGGDGVAGLVEGGVIKD